MHFESNSLGSWIPGHGIIGMHLVIDAIDANPMLTEIYIKNNPFKSKGDIDMFCDVIKHHPSLKRISIQNKGPTIRVRHDSTWIDVPYHSCKWHFGTHFDLSENQINSNEDAPVDLEGFLEANSCLEILDLQGNKLNNDDAAQIARGLASNSTLKSLDLQNNDITKVGTDALFQAIFDARSLNTVSESNHTCRIETSTMRFFFFFDFAHVAW